MAVLYFHSSLKLKNKKKSVKEKLLNLRRLNVLRLLRLYLAIFLQLHKLHDGMQEESQTPLQIVYSSIRLVYEDVPIK